MDRPRGPGVNPRPTFGLHRPVLQNTGGSAVRFFWTAICVALIYALVACYGFGQQRPRENMLQPARDVRIFEDATGSLWLKWKAGDAALAVRWQMVYMMDEMAGETTLVAGAKSFRTRLTPKQIKMAWQIYELDKEHRRGNQAEAPP